MPRPYTYLLINDANWYIGVRCANKVPAEQDTSYMSSSKYVKARIKAGEVFTKHILGEYETNEEACEAELALQEEFMDVLPGTLNKTKNGGLTYTMDKETRAKQSTSIKAAHAKSKDKRSASAKQSHSQPSVREKLSAGAKKAHARTETKEKHRAAVKASYDKPGAREKHSAKLKEMHARPEVKAKLLKPCTVDGITIYKSYSELIAALGQGKNGRYHPNFRYVQKT